MNVMTVTDPTPFLYNDARYPVERNLLSWKVLTREELDTSWNGVDGHQLHKPEIFERKRRPFTACGKRVPGYLLPCGCSL